MKLLPRLRSRFRRLGPDEKGATAVEFALLFPLFLAILFGIVTFGMVFVLQQAMTLAVEEGARAAIAVDPAAYSPGGVFDQAGFLGAVTPRAQQRITAALAWLPGTLENNAVTTVTLQAITEGFAVVVTVRYPYGAHPIIPALPLPIVGTLIPPAQLSAQAVVRVI